MLLAVNMSAWLSSALALADYHASTTAPQQADAPVAPPSAVNPRQPAAPAPAQPALLAVTAAPQVVPATSQSAAPAPHPAAASATAPAPTTAARASDKSAQRKAPPWIRTSNDDGILTFKRDVPGSSIIALRGEGIVNAPIARVASVILDYHRAPEWVDSLEEAHIVRMLSANEFVEYDHINTPPIIMADRDFLCRGKVEVDVPQQTFIMNIWPTTEPSVPEGKYVRGKLSGYWKLQAIDKGTKTYVTTEMHGDPKGGIPKWLVNFFQKGWPHNTLESLREQVAKPDIRIMPEVKAVFDGKPVELLMRHASTK